MNSNQGFFIRTGTAMDSLRIVRIVTVMPLLALLVTFASLSSAVWAQERTGTIYGRVIDASGGVIPGATIAITETLTGSERLLLSNESGNYHAPKLPTGNYVVEAELVGFRKIRRTGVVLEAGSSVEVDFKLELGEISDEINVTDTPPMINASSGAVRTSIKPIFVDRIPLAGRNANQLVVLAPGITGGVKNDYAAHGVRETSNNFSLDGIDNQDIYTGTISANPPPDALKEFTVQSNYSAEYGRGGGIAVIAITKSGTNQFHGSIYDYFRSENLNANTFARNAEGIKKPDFKQHHWGFTIGGPVLFPSLYDGRNKTFFFFNFQRLSTPGEPRLFRRGGLTAAELAGDFSQSALIPKVSTTAASQPNSPFAGMAGQEITDLSPYLSPATRRWYDQFNFPVVEQSGAFFSENRSYALYRPDATFRLDHIFSSNNTLSFSMFYKADRPELRQKDLAPVGVLGGRDLTNQHYALSDVWTIRPNFVNEIMFGYNRTIFDEIAVAGNVPFEQLGLAFDRSAEENLFAFRIRNSPSQFEMNTDTFKGEWRDVYDFRDTVSFYKGNHFMKAGVMLQMHNATQVLGKNIEFDFRGDFLGNGAADFLIGWPRGVGVSQSSRRPGRRNVSHAFFQDDWKVSPRLTINMGLRWEPMRWGYLKNDQALLFVPGVQSNHFPNLPVGTIWIAEPPSPSRSGRKDEWNNFAPRLGVAYGLGNRSVLRAGWGLFYDAIPAVHEVIDLNSDFPFIQTFGFSFNHGYPGPEGFLDPFGYEGIPTPDFSVPTDPMTAVHPNPRARPGQLMPPLSMGYVHQFNITFEREFQPGWTASAAYIGSRGVDLWGLDYWNTPLPPGPGDDWSQDSLDARRPIQEHSTVDKRFIANNGKSNYNGLEFTLKANTPYFHLLSHYTYSRSYANIDGVHTQGDALGFNRSNPFNLDADWGRSVMDIPHRVVVAFSWDLPGFRYRNDLMNKLFGNWAVTSFFNIQNGRRANVLAPENNSFTCRNCWVRADLTGEPLINKDWRNDPNLVYVNENAFSQPADGTYGNAPRNLVRWPHEKNVDVSFAKSVPIFGEQGRFELKFDMFNFFNWVNFSPPRGLLPHRSPQTLSMFDRGFGAPRTMQVGARILF